MHYEFNLVKRSATHVEAESRCGDQIRVTTAPLNL
jgi:hypothetical protein